MPRRILPNEFNQEYLGTFNHVPTIKYYRALHNAQLYVAVIESCSQYILYESLLSGHDNIRIERRKVSIFYPSKYMPITEEEYMRGLEASMEILRSSLMRDGGQNVQSKENDKKSTTEDSSS